jgi:hypothetical protein
VFERGDYLRTENTFGFHLEGKKKGQRKSKEIGGEDYKSLYQCFYVYTPDIAYHDSFIFDFPKRIYLTIRHGANDWVYRKMFEDVLAAGRVPYDLKDITRRIKNEKYTKGWLEFFTSWSDDDDKNRVQPDCRSSIGDDNWRRVRQME